MNKLELTVKEQAKLNFEKSETWKNIKSPMMREALKEDYGNFVLEKYRHYKETISLAYFEEIFDIYIKRENEKENN